MKSWFVPIVILVVSLTGCRPHPPREEQADAREAADRILLTVLAGQSTSDPGIEDMISETVLQKMPDVELYWERMDWGEQFESQMRLRFAAGEIPDIMIGKAQDINAYVPTGNIAPVSEELIEFIKPEVLSSVSRDGTVYGIPYNAFYQGVLYNKEIFERYGLSVPRSREELGSVISALEAEGILPFASHFEETWYAGNILMQFAIAEIFDASPDWGDRFREGTVSFSDSEAFQSCFFAAKEVLDHSWPDAFSVNQPECDERFARGEAAMYLTGSWSLQNIGIVNPEMELGVFPYPDGGKEAKLILEPNLTFMKSALTRHSGTIDAILRIVLEDRDLAYQIFDYTKTSSLLKNVGPEFPLLIQQDIDRYEANGMVTDATTGNSQLIWSFQEELAGNVNSWLAGEISLESVLAFADRNRMLSAP